MLLLYVLSHTYLIYSENKYDDDNGDDMVVVVILMMIFIIEPHKYTYILTEEFLVDNIYGSSINSTNKLKYLLEGLECYEDRPGQGCSRTSCTRPSLGQAY